jgi:FtsH-binding integral membrane protein
MSGEHAAYIVPVYVITTATFVALALYAFVTLRSAAKRARESETK